MGRRLCLAIGVGDAPPLDYLRGALNGATAIHAWAVAQGYDATLLTDEKDPVCAGDVKAALEALLGAGEAERLILYFAGHGLSRGAGEDLWLPSQWRDTQEAISIAGLRKRLERFGLKQLVIISDACRSIATGVDDRNLTGLAVLGRGPFAEAVPQSDTFLAASEARAAYMVPGQTARDARCIFSGLLAEALSGAHADAFDGGTIPNWKLADFLELAVEDRAKAYGVSLKPVCATGLRPPRNLYLDAAPPAPPPLAPWPAPGSGRISGMGADGTDRIAPPPGASWSTKDQKAGISLQEATPILTLPALVAEDRAAAEVSQAASAEREQAAITAFQQEQRPTHYETGAGFSLHGAALVRARLGPYAVARADGAEGWWRVEPPDQEAFDGPAWQSSIPLKQPLPLLVELADGRWAAGVAMPHFITSFTVDEAGVQALILRSMHFPYAQHTEAAMARLMARGLAASEGLQLATELRQSKHFDPMMGVLAAYLHDSMGDQDNVRRAAYFHAEQEGMIAFDLALLGRLDVVRRADGALEATIPAVPEAQAMPGRPLPGFLRLATPERRALVAGCCPLLRQGWALLDADGGGALYPPGMAELARHLLPAPFTTLDTAGGQALATRIFGKDD